MYNVVNGQNLRLDQHSAQVILENEPIFKIPSFGLDGHISWKGCYGTPSTALAALKTFSDKKQLAEEKHKELVDIFSGSIFRTDKDKPETKDLHPTITAAPPSTMLKIFGGPLSYEDFTKRFDEAGIMTKIFAQKLPENEKQEPMDGEASDAKGLATDWYSYVVPHDGKCNNDFVAQLPNIRVQVPRNMTNVLRWLQEVYRATFPGSVNTDTFCVLLHHERKNVVAVGDAFEWHEGHFNNLASNMLTRQQVFGDVTFISKSAPVYSKKKKSKKTPAASTSADADVIIDDVSAAVKSPESVKIKVTIPAAKARVKSIVNNKAKKPKTV